MRGLWAALVEWPTLSALRTAGEARVQTLISKRSKRSVARLTDQIWAALRSQTVAVVAEATWGETIGADLDRVVDHRERLAVDIEAALLVHRLRTSAQHNVGVRAPQLHHRTVTGR